jgi:plasmid stabilization system protein ParE
VKVVFADSAEADLEAIGNWIAEDDPVGAAAFLRQLRDRCLSLSDKPNRFPVAFRLGRNVVRKLVHRDYLIFYVVRAAEVEIVHILHGARDWAALLGDGR